MPVLVVSDIHGSEKGMRLVENAVRFFDPSLILSAGDQCPNLFYAPFYSSLVSVRGNMDRFYEYGNLKFPPPYLITEVLGRKVFMTHGDMYSLGDFETSPGDIFISGHTHVPVLYKDKNGVIILNPGSPSFPRSGYGPTLALIDTKGIRVLTLPSHKKVMSLSF